MSVFAKVNDKEVGVNKLSLASDAYFDIMMILL